MAAAGMPGEKPDVTLLSGRLGASSNIDANGRWQPVAMPPVQYPLDSQASALETELDHTV